MALDGSCDDLYTPQNYVNTMNYSDNENDFQTLKLDEALFENISSRSRSEAQLSTAVSAGLQEKAMKLDDLSNEKVLEFYDLHTPKNSPRRKNRVSCSTGDLVSEPSPSLSARNSNIRQVLHTESPLVNQQPEQILTVTIEHTDCTENHDVEKKDSAIVYKQLQTTITGAHAIDQMEVTTMPSTDTTSLQEADMSCISKDSLREATGTPDSGVVMHDDIKSQGDSSVKPDNTSDDSVTTDSKSDTLSVHSSVQNSLTPPAIDSIENTEPIVAINNDEEPTEIIDDITIWETVADRKKRYLQTVKHSKIPRKSSTESQSSDMASCSLTRLQADFDCRNSDEEPTGTLSSSKPMLNPSPEEPKPLLKDDSSSNSDMEEMQSPLVSTKLLPCDNVTQTCHTNPLLSDYDSSDEDCEMVQPSAVAVHRAPIKSGIQDTVQKRVSRQPLQRTLNHKQNSPSLSDDDSSDEDCEMVQPSATVVYRSPVKSGGEDTVQKRVSWQDSPLLSDHDSSDDDCEMVQPSAVAMSRASVKTGTQVQKRISHPPLQRKANHKQARASHPPLKTSNHEQTINGTVQQRAKKLRHKPSLKSIVEEDGDYTHHTIIP